MRPRLEKLKIVFRLLGKSGPAVPIGNETLRRSDSSEGVDDRQIFQQILQTKRKLGIFSEEIVRPDGTAISIAELEKHVVSEGRWGPSFSINDLTFTIGKVAGLCQSYLLIQENRSGAAKSWDEWVSPFLVDGNFIQAWISDVDYDYWQNATDPDEYASAGRDCSRLPKKSNDLPFPLERQVIDTSRNPGRWVLHTGYIEAVGSTMWLGDLFWKAVGKDKQERLKAAKWLQIVAVGQGAVRITASDHCFADESNAAIQDALRGLLFN